MGGGELARLDSSNPLTSSSAAVNGKSEKEGFMLSRLCAPTVNGHRILSTGVLPKIPRRENREVTACGHFMPVDRSSSGTGHW
jgi:hypothetical protein